MLLPFLIESQSLAAALQPLAPGLERLGMVPLARMPSGSEERFVSATRLFVWAPTDELRQGWPFEAKIQDGDQFEVAPKSDDRAEGSPWSIYVWNEAHLVAVPRGPMPWDLIEQRVAMLRSIAQNPRKTWRISEAPGEWRELIRGRLEPSLGRGLGSQDFAFILDPQIDLVVEEQDRSRKLRLRTIVDPAQPGVAWSESPALTMSGRAIVPEVFYSGPGRMSDRLSVCRGLIERVEKATRAAEEIEEAARRNLVEAVLLADPNLSILRLLEEGRPLKDQSHRTALSNMISSALQGEADAEELAAMLNSPKSKLSLGGLRLFLGVKVQSINGTWHTQFLEISSR